MTAEIIITDTIVNSNEDIIKCISSVFCDFQMYANGSLKSIRFTCSSEREREIIVAQ
jgi:hypothetical protein